MPRETREDRAAREAREQAAAEAALESYLLTVPVRLMNAQALAQKLGVGVTVSLSESGPVVKFYDDNHMIDDTLTYQTEEWELEYLERKLRDIKEEQDAKAARLVVAQDIFSKLTAEEKAALKENMHWLR